MIRSPVVRDLIESNLERTNPAYRFCSPPDQEELLERDAERLARKGRALFEIALASVPRVPSSRERSVECRDPAPDFSAPTAPVTAPAPTGALQALADRMNATRRTASTEEETSTMTAPETHGPTLADLRAYGQPNDTLNADSWRLDNLAGVERESREKRIDEAGRLAASMAGSGPVLVSVTGGGGNAELRRDVEKLPGRNLREKCSAYTQATLQGGQSFGRDELFRLAGELHDKIRFAVPSPDSTAPPDLWRPMAPPAAPPAVPGGTKPASRTPVDIRNRMPHYPPWLPFSTVAETKLAPMARALSYLAETVPGFSTLSWTEMVTIASNRLASREIIAE